MIAGRWLWVRICEKLRCYRFVLIKTYKLSQTKTATFGRVAVFVLLLKKAK